MRVRFRPWHLATLVVVLCLAGLAGLELLRIRDNSSPAQLIRRLPSGDAAVFYVDVAALRRDGLLDLLERAPVDEEVEYRDFVADTGFDYTRDLDSALIAVYASETFLLLKGRFDWGQLVDYAESGAGICYNGFCRIQGSTPERRVSFFAISPVVMGMAVGSDSYAASSLGVSEQPEVKGFPQTPLWLMMSGTTLKRARWLPSGTRSYVSAMEDAGRVTLALAPAGSDFEAQLRVDCESEAHAENIAGQWGGVTDMLRSLIRREHKKPN
ncbi:MAG: hypothetical protein GY953_41920, partial [bacterium]|nr:hypothetical protein [bacterium]